MFHILVETEMQKNVKMLYGPSAIFTLRGGQGVREGGGRAVVAHATSTVSKIFDVLNGPAKAE